MTHKIMVVDDNSATRRMVRNALQRSGHAVLEAPDGKTARALMQAEHPRVVLQDLMLPDTDGFTLVGELRALAKGADVAILAFSGFVSELDEARVSAVGFDDMIAKPIAPSRLVPLIEAHLPSLVPPTGQFGAGRRIVLADDEPMQLKLASFRLSRLGFEVEAVGDGRAALDAIRRKVPDAIVSDVMMPELDGFGLLRALRADERTRDLPIMMLSARAGEEARVEGLEAGADDYLVKPFAFSELLARLRALARRGDPERPAILELGGLRLDPATRQVWRGASEIRLSAKEFTLLETFMRRPGEVLSRLTLLEHAWDFGYDNRSNVIDVYVRRLRLKIDEPFGTDSLETVRGAGYRLRPESP